MKIISYIKNAFRSGTVGDAYEDIRLGIKSLIRRVLDDGQFEYPKYASVEYYEDGTDNSIVWIIILGVIGVVSFAIVVILIKKEKKAEFIKNWELRDRNPVPLSSSPFITPIYPVKNPEQLICCWRLPYIR
jgi:hypothetical protein